MSAINSSNPSIITLPPNEFIFLDVIIVEATGILRNYASAVSRSVASQTGAHSFRVKAGSEIEVK